MGITERIDAITEIPTAHRVAAPPCPRSVKIELTGRCNLDCSFCARSARLREQRDMDRGFFERLTGELSELGIEELGLFYLGESFLLDWVPDAVAHAKRIGIPYVFLTTNGTVATPKKMRASMAAGLDSLKFSLNYADEEQFADITGALPALFHRMIENVKTARSIRDELSSETGRTCGLYASFILFDGEQGRRMRTLVEEVEPYVDEIYALPLYSQADLVADRQEKRGWAVTAGNRGRVGALRDPIPCWACFTEGHVTWDGKLSACCFDHDGRFLMGDLNEQPFLEAWRSRRSANCGPPTSAVT